MVSRSFLTSLRRGTVAVAVALLAGSASSGCGLSGPSPAPAPADARDTAKAPSKVPTPTHLVLRLDERRLYLMDDDPGTPVESFPIAIGKAGWETPPGRYHVEELVVDPDFLKVDPSTIPPTLIKRIPPGPTNPLGKRWIGFAHGEGWTLGIHGTPNPELLGKAVSHGCVRMRNEDVVRVYERIQLGTTVIVEP